MIYLKKMNNIAEDFQMHQLNLMSLKKMMNKFFMMNT